MAKWKKSAHAVGVPLIFRFGWHPNFIKMENIDLFILSKIGWGLVCGVLIRIPFRLWQWQNLCINRVIF
jgi:hypothetical protein